MLLEAVFLFSLSFSPLCLALQAAPDSGCASVCIDNPTFNASSPSSFNTFESDLTCTDSDYITTDKSQKFEACNSCLRSSTAVSGNLNDQGALLHNLRATIDLCIWGFPNASSTVSSPCNIDYACDPLKGVLESSYSGVTFDTQYAYCSTANGSFLSDSLSPCIQCYQASKTQSYLANFLIALQAACEQKPAPGQTLRIEGEIFSKTQLNITSSTTPTPTANSSASSRSPATLSTGAVIGIVCAGLVILVGLSSVLFICYRKRRRSSQRGSSEMGSNHYYRFDESGIAMPTMSPAAVQQRNRQDSESTVLENESREAKIREAGLPAFQPNDGDEKLSANMVKGQGDGSQRESFATRVKTIGMAR